MQAIPLCLILLAAVALPAHCAEYHVDVTGDDASPGSPAEPFRTVQKAAGIMQPGDTCVIHEGTYRETVRPASSGEADRPMRFVAAEGETVTISGADVLDGEWTSHRKGVMKSQTVREFTQLFVDGKMMLEARWPNSSQDDLMAMERASAGEGTGYEALADPNLPEGDWNGAIVLIWPGARWNNSTRRVADYKPGHGFRYDRPFPSKERDKYHAFDPHQPKAGNPYILYGCEAALDSPGEWFLDAADRTVYLCPPDQRALTEHTVEVKQREIAFDLSGLSHVELSGLNVFAAALSMKDSRNCRVEDCHLRYVDHFRELDGYKVPEAENVVTGSGNQWRKCSIAYSAGTAIRMMGENNSLVNCIVHDADYLGTYEGAVDLGRSVSATARHCSFFRAGRDIIRHHGSKKITIEHCDLWNANMLNNDSGAIYSWGTDGEGGVIAYNWVHDNIGDHTMGIYLDNFCKNFVVHHNLVWNSSVVGICLNSDSNDNLVCNNTVLRCPKPFSTFTYGGYTSTQAGTRVLNNLVIGRLKLDDPGTFVQGELAPEVAGNGSHAIDRRGVPTADSGAIDAGMIVAGITDGFQGDAPDIGAYELGGDHWVAGADWAVESAPKPPPMDLAWSPIPKVSQDAMITRGLVMWLDASDEDMVQVDANGAVTQWTDKSGAGNDAVPGGGKAPVLVPDAMNGRPVLRGSGAGNMTAGAIRAAAGAFTLFIVSQSADNSGGPWQRIAGAYSGKGDEWVAPNWMLMRPTGEKIEAYGPTVWVKSAGSGSVLDRVTLFGAPSRDHQFLTGDIAEVLLFDRHLPFDEVDAIDQYLREKWGAK